MPNPSIPLFCGDTVKRSELEVIREICEDFKNLSQTEIAATVCELLDWVRPSGRLKVRECYAYLKQLQECGLVVLPKEKSGRPTGSKTQIRQSEDGKEQKPLKGRVREIGPVELRLVNHRRERDLWKEYIDRYHYLGFSTPFGAHLRYLVFCTKPEKRHLGCFQFSSPAWKVAARDKWIGWSLDQRKMHLQRVVQNSRFLILPWVEVKNLASHILGMAARKVAQDWTQRYGIRPVVLETFVEVRFSGTCYRAANWIPLGTTSGRGRMDQNHEAEKSPKSIWVYPLTRHWKGILRGGETEK